MGFFRRIKRYLIVLIIILSFVSGMYLQSQLVNLNLINGKSTVVKTNGHYQVISKKKAEEIKALEKKSSADAQKAVSNAKSSVVNTKNKIWTTLSPFILPFAGAFFIFLLVDDDNDSDNNRNDD